MALGHTLEMAKAGFQSVAQYIASHPRPMQVVLKKVRDAIRKALPGAEEVISYQIAAYRRHGGIVIYFAGWKEHYSLYPVTASMVAAFGDDFAPYEVNNKGTIRFRLSEAVPVRLIGRIAKFRGREVAERAMAKATKTTKKARTR
jgi:uncharacterized protein YdhG (YjbR/CyaY superfamily)